MCVVPPSTSSEEMTQCIGSCRVLLIDYHNCKVIISSLLKALLCMCKVARERHVP